MKTSLALLMLTDGRPVMHIDELARLIGKSPRTVANRISAKTFEIRTFRLDGTLVAHIDDVAAHIDALRAGAAHGAEQ